MEPYSQQLHGAVWRDENWATHLAHEEVTRLKLARVVVMLREPIAEVQNQLDATIRQNPLRR